MGRPRKQQRRSIVESALDCFWAKGYAGTSIDALSRATGASRSSLYDQFGSKRGVLRAALDLYIVRHIDPLVATLRRGGSPVTALDAALDDRVALATDPHRRGCLLGNIGAELAPTDPGIDDVVNRTLMRIGRAARTLVERGHAAGFFRTTPGRREQARLLLATLIGLPHLARSRPHRPLCTDAARTLRHALVRRSM